MDRDTASGLAPLSELSAGRIWGMLESAPDGMLMTDADGVILAVNQQVERLFGYDRADLLGREIEVLLPERLRAVHRAHRTRYRAEPNVRAMGEGLQLRARRSDGSEFPVEVSLSPLTDDEGLAVVASIRDVTERQRASAHTRRIQSAIDAVHDGVFIFEPDTLRFVYANSGASVQTGYSNEELLTMTPLHIKPEYTRTQFESLIAPLLAGDVDHLAVRTVHRRKSGQDVPVDIMLEHRVDAATLLDGQREESDSGALLVAIVRDVTEQIAVERRLVLSEKTFRTSFENAPVGMVLARVGNDGRHVFDRVNSAFADMLHRSADSLVGIDFADVSHSEDRKQGVALAIEMARGDREAIVSEQRFLRADGSSVWVLVHSSVIDRSDGARTLTHFVDITDRRERQAERERLSTMEDRERIARDIHDLVIQRLFGAGMKLQAVIPEMGSSTAVNRAHETIDELDVAIRELRTAIFSLQQREADRSVTDDVSRVVEEAVDRLGFPPTFVVDGRLDSVGQKRAAELSAAVGEALSNVARHAQASAVEVRVDVTSSALTLTVTDDGRGIDPAAPPGNGLRNMSKRAADLGGDFVVRPVHTGGTELVWTVPR